MSRRDREAVRWIEELTLKEYPHLKSRKVKKSERATQ
jgi:hypothetical protein